MDIFPNITEITNIKLLLHIIKNRMKRKGSIIKKLLFRILPFEQFLYVISQGYFLSYRMGRLKKNPAYDYHYFLKNIVRNGDTVVDIGANLGYYSRNLSEWVGQGGRVISYEPVKPVFNVLSKNVSKCKNVELRPFALGENESDIELGNMTKSAIGYIATGSHFVMEEGKSSSEELVTFTAKMKDARLEFKSIGKVDLIKCDVEGYEVKILSHLSKYIEKVQPIIFVESHGSNRSKVIKLLNRKSYKGYILKNQHLIELAQANDTFTDILFIPPHRIPDIQKYFMA
jgi:FkbM family methyltransferase